MLRVLPREAAEIIAATFPWAATEHPEVAALRLDSVISLGAIVAVIDGIPEELLPVGAERIRLTLAIGAMRAALQRWASGGHEGQSPILAGMPALGHHPLVVVYRLFRTLPDEAPAVTEVALSFIANADIRRSIRTDMSNADRAVATGEWKAATVLAGSVIEALLLWATTESVPAVIAGAAAAWKDASPNEYNRAVETRNPEEWMLRDYVEIAFPLGEISDATRKAVLVTKEYRNLIHPGRVLRLGADASHGTALMATGAMREVASELERRHPPADHHAPAA